MSNHPGLKDWMVADLLSRPEYVFVLWAIQEGLCSSVDEFAVHFEIGELETAIPAEQLIARLEANGFLLNTDGKLTLTELAYDALARLTPNQLQVRNDALQHGALTRPTASPVLSQDKSGDAGTLREESTPFEQNTGAQGEASKTNAGPTIFGIDLGTTNSCIAYVDANGKPTVVANAEGDMTTPSVIFFERPSNVVVGKEAKNNAFVRSDYVVEMVKRQVGNSSWRFLYTGTEYTPEELSSYILRKVIGDAETLIGQQISDVVISCPAYFDSAQREATARAGELAGLKVWGVIEEPTAAAIDYGLQNHKDQNVLVYDLGGGTFDVTMIEIKDGSLRVIAVGGDHQLGGRDWDEAIVNYVANQWMIMSGSADDPRSASYTLQDLWTRAENAKKSLSATTETKIKVTHNGKTETVILTREKFDELTSGLLERTIQLTTEMLAIARQKGYFTFDQVLLVGGSIRMPQVLKRLTREFISRGVTPKFFDPDQAVAKGAAVYGQHLALGQHIRIEIAKLTGKSVAEAEQINLEQTSAAVTAQATRLLSRQTGLTERAIDQVLKMTVTLVATHSYGVIVINSATRREEIANLIVAQTPLPTERTERFGTEGPNAASVIIRVVQNGVLSASVEDVSLGQEMGTAVIAGLPYGLPASSPIDVTFTLKSGILYVVGVEPTSGKRIEAEIMTNGEASEEEIAAARQRVGLTRVS